MTFNVGTNPALCGTAIDFQWLDFDTSSGLALPLGTSEVLKVVVGQ